MFLPRKLNESVEGFAETTTRFTGSTTAFLAASGLISAWLITGPMFGFGDTWQLVMNTISSIVTFLMVFLIQRSQNKESLAIQLKLNELIAATKGASNRMIFAEGLKETDLNALKDHFKELADIASSKRNVSDRISIEKIMKETPVRDSEILGLQS